MNESINQSITNFVEWRKKLMLHFISVCSIVYLYGGVSTLLTEDMLLYSASKPSQAQQSAWVNRTDADLQSYHLSDTWPDACVTHTWTEPFLNDSWVKVSQDPTYSRRSVRCVCVYPSHFFYYYLFKKKILSYKLQDLIYFGACLYRYFWDFLSNEKELVASEVRLALNYPLSVFFCCCC